MGSAWSRKNKDDPCYLNYLSYLDCERKIEDLIGFPGGSLGLNSVAEALWKSRYFQRIVELDLKLAPPGRLALPWKVLSAEESEETKMDLAKNLLIFMAKIDLLRPKIMQGKSLKADERFRTTYERARAVFDSNCHSGGAAG
ncbi:unnamed protein product [Amoebophrya sp. A25]|nr:unnamed protein product [Amoebophrya sp. A25]|eukprot:GSA25T00026582001.1